MKLLTLNLHGLDQKFGPWEPRLRIIADGIRSAACDVAVFQNAWREDNDGDQVSDIATETGGRFRYQSFHPLGDGSEPLPGMGILSRFPMGAVQEFPLRIVQAEDGSTRMIVYAHLDTPLGHIHLFNCHFSWIEKQNEHSRKEALALFESIPGPKLVAGDFNAEVEGGFRSDFEAAGLIDGWSALRGTLPGFTFTTREPRMRIDHIWMSRELRPALKRISLMFAEPGADGSYGSEHMGVLAEFEV